MKWAWLAKIGKALWAVVKSEKAREIAISIAAEKLANRARKQAEDTGQK